MAQRVSRAKRLRPHPPYTGAGPAFFRKLCNSSFILVFNSEPIKVCVSARIFLLPN